MVDARFYILGGILVLFVVLLAYLLVALRRYRHAVRDARAWQSQIGVSADRDGALPDAAHSGLTFPDVTEVLGAPLRTGDWMPDAPRPARERSSENLVDVGRGAVPSDAAVEKTLAASTVAMQPAPEPPSEPPSEPAPAHEPSPSPSPEFESGLESGLESSIRMPSHPRVTVHPRPDDVAAALRIPTTEPPAAPLPVVMHAQPAVVTPSVGKVLSSAAEVPSARAADLAPTEVAPSPSELEYHLVAAVELQFTTGEARVGVRPGSPAFGEFQRLAGLLLADLADLRSDAVAHDGLRIP